MAWLPTISLDKLARLDLFAACDALVRRLTAAENDAARSEEPRRDQKPAENRCIGFVLVDALLVNEGTSSIDAWGKSADMLLKDGWKKLRSVVEGVLTERETSDGEPVKSGEGNAELG